MKGEKDKCFDLCCKDNVSTHGKLQIAEGGGVPLSLGNITPRNQVFIRVLGILCNFYNIYNIHLCKYNIKSLALHLFDIASH